MLIFIFVSCCFEKKREEETDVACDEQFCHDMKLVVRDRKTVSVFLVFFDCLIFCLLFFAVTFHFSFFSFHFREHLLRRQCSTSKC